MSMSEADIQNSVRLALNDYAIIFRVNTGKVKMADGRFFDSGVPRGFPDLTGHRKSDGKSIYIEVKNKKGKTSKFQNDFLNEMKKYDVIVGVVRSSEEAVELVKNG